jgi:DNA-binding LytR/AlgR family response regulator
MQATALIAEDEPLLARALAAELQRAWPDLDLLPAVGDGASAVAQALALQPDVLFFDIRMPGMSGLEAAAVLAEDWPAGDKPFPQLVFVTAYDQYALEAFDRQAVDYVLKPVRAERLAQTVTRVQQRLGQRTMATEPAQTPTASAVPPPGFTPEQWTTLQAAVTLSTRAAHQTIAPARLSVLQVSVSSREGSAIRMLPVGEVLYFEAADKYVRVLTSDAEYLIRTPIKDLLPQLDPQVFWQIHRSTVVQAGAIERVTRDESGKQSLSLRGRADKLIVSRLYSHLFKAL